MATFDYEGARGAGYSDQEILGHLAQEQGFDVQGALGAGYSPQEVLQHLLGGGGGASTGAKVDSGFTEKEAASARKAYAQQDPRRLDVDSSIFPTSLSQLGRTADNAVRGLANAVTFGFADELAAKADAVLGINTTGRAVQQDASTGGYSEKDLLEGHRQRDNNLVTKGAEIVGTMAMPAGVPARLATKAGTVGATALAGALTGGLYGAGTSEADTVEGRLGSAAGGAAFGGLIGGALGGAVKLGTSLTADKAAMKGWQSIQEVKDQSSRLFQEADDLGISFKPSYFNKVSDDIESRLAQDGVTRTSPLNAHQEVYKAVDYIKQAGAGDKPLNWGEMQAIRQQLSTEARTATDANYRRLVGGLVDDLDTALLKVQPKDLQGATPETVAKAYGKAKEAREGWKQALKAETLDDILYKVDAKGEVAVQSDTKAIKSAISSLMSNKRKWNLYTSQEKAMIAQVGSSGLVGKGLDLAERLNRGALGSISSAGAAIQSGGLSLLGNAAIAGAGKVRDIGTRSALEKVSKAVANKQALPVNYTAKGAFGVGLGGGYDGGNRFTELTNPSARDYQAELERMNQARYLAARHP